MITLPARRLTLALAGAAALLAGCGGEPAAIQDKDAVLRLKLDEYSIDPQVIRVVATSVPMPIKIVAKNLGRLTHNVRIERVDPEPTPEGTATVAANDLPLEGTPTAQPGQTVRTVEPILLPPGEYRLTDTIGNHDNLGQYGTLTIEAPPAK